MSTEEYPTEREAATIGDDSPAIYSDEWWEGFASRNPRFGSTVEKVRDALDLPTWRSDRAKRLAAAEAGR